MHLPHHPPLCAATPTLHQRKGGSAQSSMVAAGHGQRKDGGGGGVGGQHLLPVLKPCHVPVRLGRSSPQSSAASNTAGYSWQHSLGWQR